MLLSAEFVIMQGGYPFLARFLRGEMNILQKGGIKILRRRRGGGVCICYGQLQGGGGESGKKQKRKLPNLLYFGLLKI